MNYAGERDSYEKITSDDQVEDGRLKTITRAKLRETVYSKLPQLSRSQIAELVDLVLEEISTSLIRGEKVNLRGFGLFKIRHKKERMGRNPKNLAPAVITSRRVVSFYPSPRLTAQINKEEYSEPEEIEE